MAYYPAEVNTKRELVVIDSIRQHIVGNIAVTMRVTEGTV